MTQTNDNTASSNVSFFPTKKAALAYVADSGWNFFDAGKDAPKGERWGVEVLSTRKARTGTKAAQVRNIVRQMDGKARKDVVVAIMEKTGLKKVAAGTYYYNARTALGL